MDKLTNGQRQYLRRQANALKPIVQIGKNGVTDNLMQSLDQALNSHELIKIKFGDFQDQREELAEQLASDSGSELVMLIGNVAVLYRENPDPDSRKINLPHA